MVCPLKELGTSALSASPRRLTEGVLEVEGPTSADAGVASCLLVNAEPVFRRLRDDLLDRKIFVVGMTQGCGFKVQKRSVKSVSRSSRELQGATTILEKLQELQGKWRWASDRNSGNSVLETLVRRTVVALDTKHWGNSSQRNTLQNDHQTYRPKNIYCRR